MPNMSFFNFPAMLSDAPVATHDSVMTADDMTVKLLHDAASCGTVSVIIPIINPGDSPSADYNRMVHCYNMWALSNTKIFDLLKTFTGDDLITAWCKTLHKRALLKGFFVPILDGDSIFYPMLLTKHWEYDAYTLHILNTPTDGDPNYIYLKRNLTIILKGITSAFGLVDYGVNMRKIKIRLYKVSTDADHICVSILRDISFTMLTLKQKLSACATSCVHIINQHRYVVPSN